MSRERRRCAFTTADMKRAIKAAKAAGMAHPCVKVAPDGSITVKDEPPRPDLQPAPDEASIWRDCA